MIESSDTYTEAGDLLPIGDVARALGVTVATVRRWDAAGHIVSVRTPGGQRRFTRSEIERLRGSAAS
jgi:excisionase family DNA binding protein